MILVTGASGFIGRALVPWLASHGLSVRVASRVPLDLTPGVEQVVVPDVGPDTNWSEALRGVEGVVHLAGLAHVLHRGVAPDPRPYMLANYEGTLRLAREAAAHDVKTFVFLSSVKVHGSQTEGRVLSERDLPEPDEPYGTSKWLAEQGIAEISGLRPVILRPVLVYGPGVKANFFRLIDWTANRRLLPLGGLANRRSFLGVKNLCAAIHVSLQHPEAAGQTFMVSDGEELSTPDLVRRIANSLEVPARLVSVPRQLLELAARVAGRRDEWQRLSGDLVVSTAKLRERLGFRPPYSVDQCLDETVRWYRSSLHS